MSAIPTLEGIESQMVVTPRLRMHVLTCGPRGGEPVLFVHGNASSATYWEEIMLSLPEGFFAVAPDLRGYGETEDKLIGATRGVGDFVDDLLALADTMGLDRFHVVGHSMGGSVIWALVPAAGARILSVTQVAPGSPFGFGGSKDLKGAPCFDDFAGSGGGTVNPEFVRLIGAGDRSEDNPQASPRVVMNSFYWVPPFRPDREEELLSSLLATKTGTDKYPGDMVPSENWPNVAPGVHGAINALSPKYVGDTVERFVATDPKPPVLWVRGDRDLIVSDKSMFDMGTLGEMGAVPGWPGAEIYPPQPMVGQTRAVLDRYAEVGGIYTEEVIAGTGHTPYVEAPDDFARLLNAHLLAHKG